MATLTARSIQLLKTTSSCRPLQATRRKKLHSLMAGLQLAAPILAGRIALGLLLLTGGMVVVQPCTGQSGTWTVTGNLNTARSGHTATLLQNGTVLVAAGIGPDLSHILSSAELGRRHP